MGFITDWSLPSPASLDLTFRSDLLPHALWLLRVRCSLSPGSEFRFTMRSNFSRSRLASRRLRSIEHYIAFYADYVNLDRMLSKDTVLLVQDFRLSAAYAPRPVVFRSCGSAAGKTDGFVRVF